MSNTEISSSAGLLALCFIALLAVFYFQLKWVNQRFGINLLSNMFMQAVCLITFILLNVFVVGGLAVLFLAVTAMDKKKAGNLDDELDV